MITKKLVTIEIQFGSEWQKELKMGTLSAMLTAYSASFNDSKHPSCQHKDNKIKITYHD